MCGDFFVAKELLNMLRTLWERNERTLFLIVAVIGLSFSIFGIYLQKTRISAAPVHDVPSQIVVPIREQSQPLTEEEKRAMSCIEAVNEKNRQIKMVVCEDIVIQADRDFATTLWASVFYEKDKRFRMKTESRTGLETDVGSNDQQFWFWSRRMRPPTLYYADHADLIKTRLRTPLHPLWLMECMGVTEIGFKNTVVKRQGEYLAAFQPRVSTLGALVTKMTLIDPKKQVIVGHYLYNQDDVLIASNEVIEFHTTYDGHMVPKKTKVLWQEEGVKMLFDFNGIQVNTPINPAHWNLPDYRRKTNMIDVKW